MRIEIPNYEGLLIEDFEVILYKIVDYPIMNKFQPIIIIKSKNINIMHECDFFDYVNNTWTNEDVDNALDNYLKKLEK